MRLEDLLRLQEIYENVNNKEWLDSKNIGRVTKGGLHILNYNQGGPRNEYNRLTRGAIFLADNTYPLYDGIVSLPFTRFFNYGEKDAALINLDNSDMIEKLDGTMVSVTQRNDSWRPAVYQTRRLVSTSPEDMNLTVTSFQGKPFKLMQLIGEYVSKLKLQENITYTFELIHEASFVWTKYKPEEWGFYLIGARRLIYNPKLHKAFDPEDFYPELSETELNSVALDIGAKRPKLWDGVGDFAVITNLMDQAKRDRADFEGFVFRDRKTGERLKLKDADYVQHHKMLGKYSVSDLVKAVLEGEIEEVAAYYPHLLKPMEDLKEAIDQYYSKAVNACRYMNRMDRYTRAEIYEDSTYQYDSFIVKQVMNNLGKTDLEIIDNVADAIKNLGLGFGKTAGQPKRLIELLRYNSLLHTEESDTLNV